MYDYACIFKILFCIHVCITNPEFPLHINMRYIFKDEITYNVYIYS